MSNWRKPTKDEAKRFRDDVFKVFIPDTLFPVFAMIFCACILLFCFVFPVGDNSLVEADEKKFGMIGFSFFFLFSFVLFLKSLRVVLPFLLGKYEVIDAVFIKHREGDGYSRNNSFVFYYVDARFGDGKVFIIRTSNPTYFELCIDSNMLVARLSPNSTARNNFWGIID